MKIYKTQSEVKKDIVNGVLTIAGDVTFDVPISINASIVVTNGGDINAWDLNARDITARDILYYAFCCVYKGISCLSIVAKREKAKKPICLDGKIKIRKVQS